MAVDDSVSLQHPLPLHPSLQTCIRTRTLNISSPSSSVLLSPSSSSASASVSRAVSSGSGTSDNNYSSYSSSNNASPGPRRYRCPCPLPLPTHTPPPLAPMTELLHHPLQQHHQHHQQQQHQLSSTSLFSTTVASGVNSIRPFSSPSSPHPPSSAITSTAAAASTTTVPMASISIPMDLPLSNLSTLHPSAGSPSSSSSIPWMTSATSTQHNSNNNNSNTSLSESPSSSGFSLVRFFSRRASQKAPAQRQSSLRAIYLHPQRAKPAEDRTLQKRPISTTSSSDGYYWSEGGPSTMKERSADGFPIITLTSPTNSESSIPRHEDYAPSFSGQQDNTDSPYASATAAAAASTSSGSRPLWRAGAMESLDSSTPSRRRSSEKSLMPESPEYQPPNPLIPSHMFLHPLTTYTRPIASPPQTKASPTPPSSSSRSDFPPTYEEALDAGASSSCGRPPGEHS